ncbi:MAG: inner membrane protein YpjD [Steroidobacterales bacterium]
MIHAIILFAIYAAGAWVMLRSVSNRRLEPYAAVLTLAAIIAHSEAIVRMMRAAGAFSIGLLEAISLLAWALAVLAVILAFEKQTRVLASILLASAGVGSLATSTSPSFDQAAAPGWEMTAHILLSMGAAALLFAAAVTAILSIVLDHRLRSRRLVDLPRLLPPLDLLEKAMFRLIGTGLVLLTLSLFTGFVFVTNLFAQHLIHKTVLSLIAWAVFAVLLVGRIRYGWRGRSAVIGTLAGFVILSLAYFGSKFVLETLLGRHWG